MRAWHRRRTFARALRKFIRDPHAAAAHPSKVLDSLVYGWDNSGWSGQSEFLSACVTRALRCEGPILECGTGLSTLLVGIVAQDRGLSMWSLEHLPEWGGRVQQALEQHRVESVQVCVRPLRSYGDFDWYALPLEAMPDAFSLLICDGPPSATRGGRYGLASIIEHRMQPDGVILLDDAERTDEQEVAAQWAAAFDLSCDLRGVDKPYFLLQGGAGRG